MSNLNKNDKIYFKPINHKSMKTFIVVALLLLAASVTSVQLTLTCNADASCSTGFSLSYSARNKTFDACAKQACMDGSSITVNSVPCTQDLTGNLCSQGICWMAQEYLSCLDYNDTCNGTSMYNQTLGCGECQFTSCAGKCINSQGRSEFQYCTESSECAFTQIQVTPVECSGDQLGFACECCAFTTASWITENSGICVDDSEVWYSPLINRLVMGYQTDECVNGTRQSPIDLDPAQAKHCLTADFNYVQFTCQELWFDGSFKIDAGYAAYVLIDSKVDGLHYKTIAETSYLEFRSPSEHTIKGHYFDLQMQIVSTSLDQTSWFHIIDQIDSEKLAPYTKKQLYQKFLDSSSSGVVPPNAVISYLFEVDDVNANSENLIFDENGMVNLSSLLSCTTNAYFYRYEGSLTIPPCTEDVQWLVSRRPIKISSAEFDRIKAYIPEQSSRQIQEANGRTVRLTGSPCSQAQAQMY